MLCGRPCSCTSCNAPGRVGVEAIRVQMHTVMETTPTLDLQILPQVRAGAPWETIIVQLRWCAKHSTITLWKPDEDANLVRPSLGELAASGEKDQERTGKVLHQLRAKG